MVLQAISFQGFPLCLTACSAKSSESFKNNLIFISFSCFSPARRTLGTVRCVPKFQLSRHGRDNFISVYGALSLEDFIVDSFADTPVQNRQTRILTVKATAARASSIICRISPSRIDVSGFCGRVSLINSAGSTFGTVSPICGL
jgi:hypothetical protein